MEDDGMTLRPSGGVTVVACDHVRREVARNEVLAAVDAGRPGRPVRRWISA
jgi:hypothetical protein